jgi:hypothetical protein
MLGDRPTNYLVVLTDAVQKMQGFCGHLEQTDQITVIKIGTGVPTTSFCFEV